MQELFRLRLHRHVSGQLAYDLRRNVPRGTLWKSFATVLVICGIFQSAHLFAKDRTPSLIHVIFSTDLGDFEVAVDPEHAPVTTANFLRYVDGGFYDGGIFHRTVKL